MVHHLSVRFLCAMFLFAAAIPLHAADEDAPATSKSTEKSAKTKSADGLQGYYAIVAKEVGMTEAQRKELITALASRDEAVKTWDETNGAKLTELTAAQDKAKEAKDVDAAKKAGDELKALRSSRNTINDQGKAKLIAILTPEQRTRLHGYDLYVGAMVKFSKAELTPEQKKQARALAIDTGKLVKEDMKAKELNQVKTDLAAKIEKDILTEAQRETMTKLAAEKGKGKAKGKSEKSKTEEGAK